MNIERIEQYIVASELSGAAERIENLFEQGGLDSLIQQLYQRVLETCFRKDEDGYISISPMEVTSLKKEAPKVMACWEQFLASKAPEPDSGIDPRINATLDACYELKKTLKEQREAHKALDRLTATVDMFGQTINLVLCEVKGDLQWQIDDLRTALSTALDEVAYKEARGADDASLEALAEHRSAIVKEIDALTAQEKGGIEALVTQEHIKARFSPLVIKGREDLDAFLSFREGLPHEAALKVEAIRVNFSSLMNAATASIS